MRHSGLDEQLGRPAFQDRPEMVTLMTARTGGRKTLTFRELATMMQVTVPVRELCQRRIRVS